MLLRGKLAVVAGFGAGMARQVAVSLAREGADLVVFGGDEPAMVSAAGEIAAVGRKALCVPVAAPDRSAGVSLATRVGDIFGRVDVLVHNSARPPAAVTPFEDADLDDWRATVDAELFGPLILTQTLLPLLRASADGRVIVIGNRSGTVAESGYGAQAAVRAALDSLTRTLAHELGPSGIRVNAVHPGSAERRPAGDEMNGNGENTEPKVTGPTAEEIAGAVVFLASPFSRAVTGQSLLVDAGRWPA